MFYRMTTRRQWKLFWYYVDDLGLSHEEADSVIFTAWVYGLLDKQLP
jgi:hypothetical protein